jgi:UDP-GlcNAc:undecaprenyl-phosphate GlcNAc-1-phosphate transferase
VLYGFCVLFGAVALVLTYANSVQSAFVLVALGVVAFAALRALGYMRLDRMSDTASERRKNKALRSAARPLGPRLRQVRTLEEAWIVVTEAGEIFGAVTVRVGPRPAFSHEFERTEADQPFEARFALPGLTCTLELGWCDGRREIDRDTEIAVDIFCEHLAEALARLASSPAVARLPAS